MRLLEGLAELVAPTRCAGCELPGRLLCDVCEREATALVAEQACGRCAAPHGRLVCTECWNRTFSFEAALSLGELAGPLARAVVLHKDASERRLGPYLGTLLAERADREWPGWASVATWIPPTAAALGRRGFDHAHGLAAPLGGQLGVPVTRLLDRRSGADQRALGRRARARNATGAFVARANVAGRVLLVDDVLTTGSTVDAAAAALLAAGADAVRVAVVARAW